MSKSSKGEKMTRDVGPLWVLSPHPPNALQALWALVLMALAEWLMKAQRQLCGTLSKSFGSNVNSDWTHDKVKG